jgi:nucleoside-diphosphate-sugar epimerase
MREVHVDGLINVVDAVSRWPSPPRLALVSSTSVYGQTGGEPVDEEAATKPLEENGRVVLEAEQALRARLPGSLVLRFAGIYGPHRLIRGRALLAGEPVGGPPDKWLNLIHIDDGAEAVLAALERGRDGATYNVCDDRPVRRRDFYARLAELLGAPPPRFVEAAQGPQADRRVMNRRLREELGVALRYPSYEEGLAATVAVERKEEV